MKIGFVGVTIPNTIRSSFPRYFQDENGNYIYGFMEDESGEAVYNAVQKAVDEVRAAGADYVIVLGHLGNESGSAPWMYNDVISRCSGIDAWLDGHSHDTDQVIMKDKDGKDVVRSACGTSLTRSALSASPATGRSAPSFTAGAAVSRLRSSLGLTTPRTKQSRLKSMS